MMVLVSVTEEELTEIETLCKEQAKLIAEQQLLIEQMGKGALVNRAWMYRTVILFFSLQVKHMRGIMDMFPPAQVLAAASKTDEEIYKKYEIIVGESGRILTQAQKNLDAAKKAWGEFSKRYPEAVKTPNSPSKGDVVW